MLVLATIAALTVTLGTSGAAIAKPDADKSIPLNNGQETTVAKTGARGTFSYHIDGDQLCYSLSVRKLSEPAVAAHIHLAPRKTAGPVVVTLDVKPGTSWTVKECADASGDVLRAIAANPRSYYVNVHTSAFPDGEIRGQLKKLAGSASESTGRPHTKQPKEPGNSDRPSQQERKEQRQKDKELKEQRQKDKKEQQEKEEQEKEEQGS